MMRVTHERYPQAQPTDQRPREMKRKGREGRIGERLSAALKIAARVAQRHGRLSDRESSVIARVCRAWSMT